MRKVLGYVLLGLGGFLIAAAVLAKFYASDAVRVTPLDVDSVNVLTGQATIGSDAAVPVQATSTTLADSEASDDEVVVFRNSTCLVKVIGETPSCVSSDDPENRLVTVSEDVFATDRNTAEAVNDSRYLPADATEHEGLVNKFPFGTEKKTYQYWDGVLGRTVDATFEGEDEVRGVDTYKFVVEVDSEPVEVADDIQGTYSTVKTIWVEPVTGSILNQSEEQRRLTDTGENVLDLSLEMDAASSQDLVDDAVSNKRLLDILGTWVPLLGVILGALALVIGVILVRGDRSSSGRRSAV